MTIQYTKAIRLFKDEPKWTPLKRGGETDVNPFRKEYLQARDGGAIDSMPEPQTRDGALDSLPDGQRMT